jgi:prepilin-type N-terminal cleavage/methylation domain-containing protein
MSITQSKTRGYTLVEVLLALSITAGLLAAMGSAFTTAGSAVEMNDRYFRSVHQARTGMDLIMNEIRKSVAITAPAVPNSTGTYTSITLTPPSSDFSGHSITIQYNNNTAGTLPNTVTLTDNTAGGMPLVLAGEDTTQTWANPVPVVVTGAQFTVMPGVNASNQPCIAAISLTMTVKIGENSVTLSGTAAPRVNLVSLYQ